VSEPHKRLKSYAILFDLDGTIIDIGHRLKHLRKPVPDWDAFYAAADSDDLIPGGAVIYNLIATQARMLGHAIKEGGHDAEIPFVDIITWRPERMRPQTIAWLATCGLIMPRALHMRADDDNRHGEAVKLDMFERHYDGKENVLAVFEDNPLVIRVFREIGIHCYQTAP
jgi:hypothetical protein